MTVIIIVLVAFLISFISAENNNDSCALELLNDFEQCSDKTWSSECIPFPPLITLDYKAAKLGLTVLFGQFLCDSPPKESEFPSLVFFYFYKKNHHVKIANGADFAEKPFHYVSKSTKCIRVFIAGFTSDCSTDVYDVPKRNDWLSFSAKTVTCQTDCIAIVVNWGTFSGKDYACIVANMIQPFGNFLGKIFCKLGPSKIFISGHSLGAHIGGFASKYVKNNCGIIREMAGYDPAGPLIRNNQCLWQLGAFECGMDKDVALRTIAVYSNPGGLGTANFNLTHINIKCNPPHFNQPGATFFDPLYNHNFATSLCAAISGGIRCYDQRYPQLNLNHMYNHNIPSGTYELILPSCFPFACEKDRHHYCNE